MSDAQIRFVRQDGSHTINVQVWDGTKWVRPEVVDERTQEWIDGIKREERIKNRILICIISAVILIPIAIILAK